MNISLGCTALLLFLSSLSSFLFVQAQDYIEFDLCGGIPPPNREKRLICPVGSYIIGDPTLVCAPDRKWRAAGTCVSNRPNDYIRPCRRCCPYQLPVVYGGRVSEGLYRAGAERDIICDTPQPVFTPTIICDQSRVVWAPSSYNCSGQFAETTTRFETWTTTGPKQCPSVVQIVNGYAAPLSVFEGSIEKYTCNFGFQPRLETMLCRNGQWLGAVCDLKTTTTTTTTTSTTTTYPPTTTPIRRCSFNPNVKNGNAYPRTALEGEETKVTCNNGFVHKNPKNPNILCYQGQWIGDAMICHKQPVEAGATAISTSGLPIFILIIFQFFFNF